MLHIIWQEWIITKSKDNIVNTRLLNAINSLLSVWSIKFFTTENHITSLPEKGVREHCRNMCGMAKSTYLFMTVICHSAKHTIKAVRCSAHLLASLQLSWLWIRCWVSSSSLKHITISKMTPRTHSMGSNTDKTSKWTNVKNSFMQSPVVRHVYSKQSQRSVSVTKRETRTSSLFFHVLSKCSLVLKRISTMFLCDEKGIQLWHNEQYWCLYSM